MAYEIDPDDPGLQRRHGPAARRRRSSSPTACATAIRASTSSSSSRTPTRSERWSASTASTSSRRRVDLRLLCCNLRKVRPLTKHLHSLDAWVTGLRRDQWASRTNIRKVEIDHDHGAIVKLNPLAEWTKDEVWDYVRERDVPYHSLYDQGYTSIGCAPCTRAIEPGEAEPRRPLVVGVERAEGVRHPLLDRERRPRARAARDPRRQGA